MRLSLLVYAARRTYLGRARTNIVEKPLLVDEHPCAHLAGT